jgi:ubiquinone/menaquinone biosynthesis C-methylase UbiE
VGTAAAAWLGYKTRSFELLLLAEGDQVLDVGCGLGEDVRAIAGLVRGVSVVGIDASEDKIREASAETLGLPRPVDFRVGDAYGLPFEGETFDACRADRVFHHLVDPQKALAEMARVTRPGGRIAVSDTDYDSLVVEAVDRELTRRILQHHADRMECGRVGRKLPGLFLDAGLTMVTVTPYAAVATEYDEEVLKLRDKADRAAAEGVVARADAERWVEGLVEAAGGGRFVCAQLVLTVSGRKA